VQEFDRRPQLITYPDSFGGSIGRLNELLRSEMNGWFTGGTHLLPPFPSSADRGFAPTRYDQIDPAFGSWEDLEELASLAPLTLDVMVNHHSAQSAEFRDFAIYGRASEHADMFMRPDKLWPNGSIPDEDLDAIFLRKPGDPFLELEIEQTGAKEVVWATFGTTRNESEQIDLDWESPLTRKKYDSWFHSLASAGAAEIRLDAVGYLSKRAGTSSFMVEPEIWDILSSLSETAGRHGLAVLPEIHAGSDKIKALDARGYSRYDFILPGIMLDALRRGSSGRLAEHLSTLPAKVVTTLDTHDGIPIQPDLVGAAPHEDLIALCDVLSERGANLNRILGAKQRGIDFDVHQVNIAYLDAAGGEDGLAIARAVQVFGPGRPQVYYQGLLGGTNDHEAVDESGEGRSINRTNYDVDEARRALKSDVTQRQRRLLEIRSMHPAFQSKHSMISASAGDELTMRWENDRDWCQLTVNLKAVAATITMSPYEGLEPGPV